jgi:hypothetical protein
LEDQQVVTAQRSNYINEQAETNKSRFTPPKMSTDRYIFPATRSARATKKKTRRSRIYCSGYRQKISQSRKGR